MLSLPFSASAQNADPSTPPGEKPRESALATDVLPADSLQLLSDVDKLTPDEKIRNVDAWLVESREALKKSITILGAARASKDAVKLICANDKVMAIKALARISEQSAVAMQEGIAAGNVEETNHQYTRIALSITKVRSLVTQVSTCVGELSDYGGDTEVTVEIDGGDAAGFDPTLPGVPNIGPPAPPEGPGVTSPAA